MKHIGKHNRFQAVYFITVLLWFMKIIWNEHASIHFKCIDSEKRDFKQTVNLNAQWQSIYWAFNVWKWNQSMFFISKLFAVFLLLALKPHGKQRNGKYSDSFTTKLLISLEALIIDRGELKI